MGLAGVAGESSVQEDGVGVAVPVLACQIANARSSSWPGYWMRLSFTVSFSSTFSISSVLTQSVLSASATLVTLGSPAPAHTED